MTPLDHEHVELAVRMLTVDWRYKAGVEEGEARARSRLDHAKAQRDLALVALYKVSPFSCTELCQSLTGGKGLVERIRAEAAREELSA